MATSPKLNRIVKNSTKAILFCIVFVALFILFSFVKSFIPNHYERLAHGIIGTLAALVTTLLFLKFDKKSFSDIKLRFEQSTLLKFFAGIITGVMIMGFLAWGVIYFSNSVIEINPQGDFWRFLLITAPLLPLAFMEELGFRAYPLEVLKSNVGIRASMIITSLLFALYHIVNGWPVATSFYGPAVWGLIFALAAIYSKGIAMPTGIHYAANLTTSAFGTVNNTTSLWIIKPAESVREGIDLSVILPSLILLILAIILTELFVRRKLQQTDKLLDSL
jgi:membrane protease YdiL (CAAX protease family)